MPPMPDRWPTAARHRERNAAIRKAYQNGLTLSAIGRQHGLTDARIWQIVNRYHRKPARPQPVGEHNA